MTDRHKTQPKAVRLPPGLLPRVEAAAAADGASVNSFIVAAIEEKLDRRGSDSTTPPATARKGATTPASVSPQRHVVGAAADCPHPKARVIKGFCGACGTSVGTKEKSGARIPYSRSTLQS